jgi:hypothetical protein
VRLLYFNPLTPSLFCSQVDTSFFVLLVQANLATVSAAENHLPLEHPQVCSSRFSKVDLNACHNVHHDRILPKQFLDVILTGSARRHGLPKKKLIDDNHNNIPIINYNALSSPTENAAAAGHHPYLEPHLNSKGNGGRTSTSGPEEQFMKYIVQDVFMQEENSKGASYSFTFLLLLFLQEQVAEINSTIQFSIQ